jgi:hypothetical protein
MNRKPTRNGAGIGLRLFLHDALCGGLWAPLSDRLLKILFADVSPLTRIQIRKG